MQRQTIVLATYGKSREHEHGDCMDVLEHELKVLVIKTRRHCQIDIARSLLATAALAHGADVTFFIDHDILFDPLDVERLADVARQTRGVVGAPYSMRAMGAGPVAGIANTDSPEVVFFDGGKLYPAAGVVGMGFTAIHREVYERLAQLPEFAECNTSDGILRPYFQKRIVDGFWLHEDASFCHAARAAGSTTHIDTRIRLKHVGDYGYRIEDCRRALPDEPSVRFTVKN